MKFGILHIIVDIINCTLGLNIITVGLMHTTIVFRYEVSGQKRQKKRMVFDIMHSNQQKTSTWKLLEMEGLYYVVPTYFIYFFEELLLRSRVCSFRRNQFRMFKDYKLQINKHTCLCADR